MIFRNAPNRTVITGLESPSPYDSNGITYMCMRVRYEEIRNLPCFLFTPRRGLRPSIYGAYYRSLESCSRGEFSAVGIVGNGSVVVEKKQN